MAAESGLLWAAGRGDCIREEGHLSLAMTVAHPSMPISLASASDRRAHVVRHPFVFMPTRNRGDQEFPPGFPGNQRTRSARRVGRTRFLGRTPSETG